MSVEITNIGIAKRALHDDPFCGDACGYWHEGHHTVLCIADGLGHGQHAHTASHAAVEYVVGHYSEPLLEIFSGCDKAIRHTCGVAMGICVIYEDGHSLTFAGISNTRAMIFGKGIRNLSSHNGIVGAGYRRLVPESVSLERGSLVVMFTDGLQENIHLNVYDEDIQQNPHLLALQILDDCRLGSDDAAVLVYKHGDAHE